MRALAIVLFGLASASCGGKARVPGPNEPPDEAGHPLSWAPAAVMTSPQADGNRDSAVITVPVVAGAADYRAFAVPAGTVITGGDTEDIAGTTIFCAGLRQMAAPRAPPVPVTQIEVQGLTAPRTFVVEAIDQPCPFPGLIGSAHADLPVDTPDTTLPAADKVPFSIFTEDEVRARFGSLIVNGHGAGPTLGNPAPRTAPRVLARTTIQLSPAAPASTPAVFDDFSVVDPPTKVRDLDTAGRNQNGQLWQNTKWSFYTYGAAAFQWLFSRGALHVVLADWKQEIFSSSFLVARRPPAQLSDTTYLHAIWEVGSDATARRYWWIFVCGAASAGQTVDAQGNFLGNMVQTPFFFDPDGRNPSLEGWNCFQLFMRDGSPFPLGPDNTRPQSDVRVMVNKPGLPDQRTSVVNVSPDQYHCCSIPASWYRQQRGSGTPSGPLADDLVRIAPRVRFDLWLRKDRAILYADGTQRLCNDFPNAKLSMAEAAVGFGQVLYHSAAERIEFSESFNDRTGQRYYLTDAPYADSRTWDNIGYDQNVAAPASFDASACYVAP